VVVSVGGVDSAPLLISVLRVSLLSVVPRNVLPAASGWLSYDFSVSVLSAFEVTAVVIADQHCDSPVLVSEEQLMCYGVAAPPRWSTDDVWLFINATSEAVSRRAVLRAEPAPLILAVDRPHGSPTEGGVEVRVVGEGFGLEANDFEGVLVGEAGNSSAASTWAEWSTSASFASSNSTVFLRREDGNASWVSSSTVTFALPPGMGSRVKASVATRTGLVSAAVSFPYEAPAVESVTPQVLLRGVTNETLRICGRNMPPEGAAVERVVVGGAECAASVLAASKCVVCNGTFTTSGREDWASQSVTVTVAGQTSPPAVGMVTFVPLPVIQQLSPAQISQGITVELTGNGFGTEDDYLVAAFVGGDLSGLRNGSVVVDADGSVASRTDSVRVPVVRRSMTRCEFIVPPGVGRNLDVAVVTRTGLVSTSLGEVAMHYSPPVVLSVTPVLLPGYASVNVTLQGSNLAPRQEDVASVRIGGVDCADPVAVDDTEIVCRNFQTPSSNTWPQQGVSVAVGGQTSGFLPVGVFVDPPTITSVTPTVAGPGDRLIIVGSGFGTVVGHIASVVVGGQACTSVQRISDSQLQCYIPSPHPIWTAASDDDVIPFVPVSVVLVTGLATPSSNPSRITPRGLRLRPNPWLRPQGLVAWRPLGQASVLIVRWRFPGTSMESVQNAAASSPSPLAADSFSVQTWDRPFSENGTATAAGMSTLTTSRETRSRPATTSTDPEDPDAWEWFEAQASAGQETPLYLRVRAENGDGSGPWEILSEGWDVEEQAVPSTCAESSYLATHLPLDEITDPNGRQVQSHLAGHQSTVLQHVARELLHRLHLPHDEPQALLQPPTHVAHRAG
jgi:hypothetical protein